MKLKVNSTVVSGFKKHVIMSSMDSLSDVFICSCPLSESAFSLQSGLECEVLVNDQKRITGNIGPVSIDSEESEIVWTGRDKTGDMVDCQIQSSTGEWKNQTAKQIISSIASPFGISVTGEDGKTFSKYNVERNSKCGDTIAEICSISGIVASSDSDGNIVLQKVGSQRSPIILKEGSNIQNFKFKADVSIGHSSYTVLGQSTFNGKDKVSATQSKGSSYPEQYPRFRPFVGISDIPMDFSSAAIQAEWIMRSRHSDMEQVEVSVAGVQDIFPNTLIYLNSSSMRIDGIRLVSFVKWSYSKEDGNVTTVGLTNPYKYGANIEQMTEWLSL